MPKLPLTVLVFFSLLLNSGLSAQNSVDSLKKIEFFNIIRSGSSENLEKLLQQGADANMLAGGYSALMAAALNGSADQMKLLIRHGALVNFANNDSLTALWFSVPDEDKTRLLLDAGADPQMPSKEGYTVLVKLANIPGTASLFQLLIDKGAVVRKSSRDNMLLYNAASSCDTSVLGLLIKNGLSVNDTVFYGDYPIDNALNYRCFPTLKMLVDHGANVNVNPMAHLSNAFSGLTPLMYSALSDDSLSFFYLLDHGADPRAKSKKGYTALMYLQNAEKDQPEMTLALINHGANPADKAPDGTDALTLAEKKGNSASVQLLKKYLNK